MRRAIKPASATTSATTNAAIARVACAWGAAASAECSTRSGRRRGTSDEDDGRQRRRPAQPTRAPRGGPRRRSRRLGPLRLEGSSREREEPDERRDARRRRRRATGCRSRPRARSGPSSTAAIGVAKVQPAPVFPATASSHAPAISANSAPRQTPARAANQTVTSSTTLRRYPPRTCSRFNHRVACASSASSERARTTSARAVRRARPSAASPPT